MEAIVFGVRIDMILSGLRPAVLIHEFKKKVGPPSSDTLPPRISQGLRAYWMDGAFSSLSDNLAINFFEIFLISLGGGNREVGAMASIGNLLGFLSLAPGVAAVRLFGRRKPVVVIFGGGIGRLMYVMLAFVPFLFPSPSVAIPAVIAFNGIRIFMGNFSNPAWTAMTADLVPESIRGSYFASRGAIVAILGSVAAFSAGWIVTWGNRLPGNPFAGFTILFAATFFFGMIATWFFSRVPDVGGAIRKTGRPLGDLFRGLMGYPEFIGFLAFSFLWNFALYISGPFFNVYMVRDLGSSAGMIGMVSTIGTVIQIFALPYWGRMIDRRGDLRVLTICGFIIPLLPLAWMFTTRSWEPLVVNAFGGFLWAGFNLANFNLLLKMIPESDRQEGAALYQALVLLSMVLGPLVGAEIVEAWGYRLSFAFSGASRYVALAVLYALVLRKLRNHAPKGT